MEWSRSAGRDGDEHHAEYDWEETPPSMAVIEMVSAAAGCRATDLLALHDAVDPDALDRLLTAADGTTVSFRYAAHGVTVTGDGTVRVRPPE